MVKLSFTNRHPATESALLTDRCFSIKKDQLISLYIPLPVSLFFSVTLKYLTVHNFTSNFMDTKSNRQDICQLTNRLIHSRSFCKDKTRRNRDNHWHTDGAVAVFDDEDCSVDSTDNYYRNDLDRREVYQQMAVFSWLVLGDIQTKDETHALASVSCCSMILPTV